MIPPFGKNDLQYVWEEGTRREGKRRERSSSREERRGEYVWSKFDGTEIEIEAQRFEEEEEEEEEKWWCWWDPHPIHRKRVRQKLAFTKKNPKVSPRLWLARLNSVAAEMLGHDKKYGKLRCVGTLSGTCIVRIRKQQRGSRGDEGANWLK